MEITFNLYRAIAVFTNAAFLIIIFIQILKDIFIFKWDVINNKSFTARVFVFTLLCFSVLHLIGILK